MFKVLFLALFSVFPVHAASNVELGSFISESLKTPSFEYSNHPSVVKVFAKDFFFHELTSSQIQKALQDILKLPDGHILNGNGTGILLPIDNDQVILNSNLHYEFCYESLDGYTLYRDQLLITKSDEKNYTYCDITPLIIKNKYRSTKVGNIGEFALQPLLVAWRRISNKGDVEIFYSSFIAESYLYKTPSFYFNGRQYPIKASQDFLNSENTTALGYCHLKNEQAFIRKFGKDSVKEVANQEVVELDEYGNPISIEFHSKALVWNAIVCGDED